MTENRLGYVRLSFKDLESALDLPKGMRVLSVESGTYIRERNSLHVVLSHASFPLVPEDYVIPPLTWETIEKCKNSPETTLSTP